MFQWRPHKDPSNPNYEALPARDGDNCVLGTNSDRPVLALTLGEVIDIVQSYETIGDEYYSEPNYRWPRDPLVYVPAIELRLRGGKLTASEAGEEFYRACSALGFFPGATVVGLPSGESCEVLRITPPSNEFNERFFTPRALEQLADVLERHGLLDAKDAVTFSERFLRKSLELCASRIVMRFEEYNKEVRLMDFKGLNSLLNFAEMLSPKKSGREEADLEEYRRELLNQPFVRFYGEYEPLTSSNEMFGIFTRLSEHGDYDDLEPRELQLMKRLTCEWPVGRPLAEVHPRLSLDMARFGRQFGDWFQGL